MSIDLLVFDMDGVLVDTFSYTSETDHEILQKRNKQVPTMQAYRENPPRGSWNAFYACWGAEDGDVALTEFSIPLLLKELQKFQEQQKH